MALIAGHERMPTSGRPNAMALSAGHFVRIKFQVKFYQVLYSWC